MIPENSAAEVVGVYTLLPDREKALELAEALIREKLAACVNVGAQVISFYEWDGEVRQERETPLIIKTVRQRLGALEKYILKCHPYQCPCLMALPWDYVHRPFGDWVAQQVAQPGERDAQSGD